MYEQTRSVFLTIICLRDLGASNWPDVRLLDKGACQVGTLPWLWIRHQTRDGNIPKNDRCEFCGWLSGQRLIDEEQCDECWYPRVCASCAYIDPNSQERRCGKCPLLPGAPPHVRAINAFIDYFELYDRCDELQKTGAWRSELNHKTDKEELEKWYENLDCRYPRRCPRISISAKEEPHVPAGFIPTGGGRDILMAALSMSQH